MDTVGIRALGATKTVTLAFRNCLGLANALRTVAQQEHRSISNMVGMLIRDYCGRNGVTIPEPDDLRGGENKDLTGTTGVTGLS